MSLASFIRFGNLVTGSIHDLSEMAKVEVKRLGSGAFGIVRLGDERVGRIRHEYRHTKRGGAWRWIGYDMDGTELKDCATTGRAACVRAMAAIYLEQRVQHERGGVE